MLNLDNIKTTIAVVSGLIAATAGGYKFLDSAGYHWTRPVLTWHAEHFDITDAPINGEFRIVVAREKHRDDCEVVEFSISVRDSNLMVHAATPGIATFSGPASDTVDMFAYNFYMREEDYEIVNTGVATFIGKIVYDCPEGTQHVYYPTGLKFNILPLE